MKVFAGGIATETNTFAPQPTGLAAFLAHGVHRGDEAPRNEYSPMFDTLRQLARDEGHTLVVGLGAYAVPGGLTRRVAYETLRDELLASLSAAGPVDAIVLPLHGAMAAEGYDSCESDLVERIRRLVGPEVPIGVELDLHCHMTDSLRRHADVVVAYQEYPHTDIAERLALTWRLTLATAAGLVRPVTAVFDARMLGNWPTTQEPMRGFVQRMREAERQPGVLAVNLGHGFEYADLPEAGAKLWVVADRDEALAARLAGELGRDFVALREALRTPRLELDAALDELAAAVPGRPLVLADLADNPGGGASGDSSFVLRRLVERGLGGVAIGAFWDLGAVAVCREAGVGARLGLRVGGKCGPASGAPVDLRVTVRGFRESHAQTGLQGECLDCGASAWVRTEEGIDVVLVSVREQVFDPDLFTGLGVELAACRAIVVKSAQHFHAAFAPLAGAIRYVSTPGLLRDDIENLPYRRRSPNFWPRANNPWRAGHA